MAEKLNILIREAIPQEDSLIAQHVYQLWLDNHVSSDKILTDWLDITLQFINDARQELAFKSFVPELFFMLHPLVNQFINALDLMLVMR